jgi:hypothetical protein
MPPLAPPPRRDGREQLGRVHPSAGRPSPARIGRDELGAPQPGPAIEKTITLPIASEIRATVPTRRPALDVGQPPARHHADGAGRRRDDGVDAMSVAE